MALGLRLRFAGCGDFLDRLRLRRRERLARLLGFGLVNLHRIAFDLAGLVGLRRAGDFPFDDFLLGLLLDVIDVDDVVHRHVVVDDGGMPDRSRPFDQRTSAIAVVHVVAVQIDREKVRAADALPVIVGHVAERDVDVDAAAVGLGRQWRPGEIVVGLAP